jgi:calcineurin-like phosphoesterase family protein
MGRMRGLCFSLVLLGSFLAPAEALAAAAPPPFAFGAAGDHGANSATASSLSVLNRSGVKFYLALGDLDYGEVSSPAAWCSFVKSRLPRLGSAFPFQLVSGNHENSVIQRHAACLPDRLGSRLSPTKQYAAEYFFDYPARSPLMRVVMISPNLKINGVKYSYPASSERYRWVASVIDAARTARIRWIVVGMHKNCISAGGHACTIGADLMNLFVAKKVDLVLAGHVHNYQRSKQLALRPACGRVPVDSYDADCVVDNGADGIYTKGRGTVFMIIGVFGKGGSRVDGGDAEAGYFARTASGTNGFVKFVVSASRIDAQFNRSTGATFADAFSIRA